MALLELNLKAKKEHPTCDLTMDHLVKAILKLQLQAKYEAEAAYVKKFTYDPGLFQGDDNWNPSY